MIKRDYDGSRKLVYGPSSWLYRHFLWVSLVISFRDLEYFVVCFKRGVTWHYNIASGVKTALIIHINVYIFTHFSDFTARSFLQAVLLDDGLVFLTAVIAQ